MSRLGCCATPPAIRLCNNWCPQASRRLLKQVALLLSSQTDLDRSERSHTPQNMFSNVFSDDHTLCISGLFSRASGSSTTFQNESHVCQVQFDEIVQNEHSSGAISLHLAELWFWFQRGFKGFEANSGSAVLVGKHYFSLHLKSHLGGVWLDSASRM